MSSGLPPVCRNVSSVDTDVAPTPDNAATAAARSCSYSRCCPLDVTRPETRQRTTRRRLAGVVKAMQRMRAAGEAYCPKYANFGWSVLQTSQV